jgi:predicted ATPase
LDSQLKRYLSARNLLLVLDNFEQILDAAPLVADLLSSAPGLEVIVTSRSPLQLTWERRFPVPALTLPCSAFTAPADVESAQDMAARMLSMHDPQRGPWRS